MTPGLSSEREEAGGVRRAKMRPGRWDDEMTKKNAA